MQRCLSPAPHTCDGVRALSFSHSLPLPLSLSLSLSLILCVSLSISILPLSLSLSLCLISNYFFLNMPASQVRPNCLDSSETQMQWSTFGHWVKCKITIYDVLPTNLAKESFHFGIELSESSVQFLAESWPRENC